MEPIFTIPFSEFAVIQEMSSLLKKKREFSYFIPLSRQEKGFDFVAYSRKNKKLIRCQVKGSRTYFPSTKKSRSGKMLFHHTFWFNNFINSYEPNAADLYLLSGYYTDYAGNEPTSKAKWRTLILALKDAEMKQFLSRVKTKKEKKPDRFFGLGFNDPNKVFVSRGLTNQEDFSKYLLANRLSILEDLAE